MEGRLVELQTACINCVSKHWAQAATNNIDWSNVDYIGNCRKRNWLKYHYSSTDHDYI